MVRSRIIRCQVGLSEVSDVVVVPNVICSAISSFFAGIGRGANLEGFLDWTALAFGVALLLAAIRGLMRGRIVGRWSAARSALP